MRALLFCQYIGILKIESFFSFLCWRNLKVKECCICMNHFFLAMKKYKIWKNCPTSADQKPLQHLTFGHRHILSICVQAALVIYNLFICDFSYTRLRNGLFSRTYPLIYSNLWSFNMQIHYMSAYFLSPYLLHIMRSTCTSFGI